MANIFMVCLEGEGFGRDLPCQIELIEIDLKTAAIMQKEIIIFFNRK